LKELARRRAIKLRELGSDDIQMEPKVYVGPPQRYDIKFRELPPLPPR
jgi:hypothetical protein